MLRDDLGEYLLPRSCVPRVLRHPLPLPDPGAVGLGRRGLPTRGLGVLAGDEGEGVSDDVGDGVGEADAVGAAPADAVDELRAGFTFSFFYRIPLIAGNEISAEISPNFANSERKENSNSKTKFR